MNSQIKRITFSLLSAAALSVSASAITLNPGETGDVGGLAFAVDFGTYSYVSDLSQGGLPRTADTQGSQITFDPINVLVDSNLMFDWVVGDNFLQQTQSVFSFYDINNTQTIFHFGGSGSTSGSINQFIAANTLLNLKIGTANGEGEIEDYELRIDNLKIEAIERDEPGGEDEPDIPAVPDTAPGLVGLASILGLFAAHRRMRQK